MDAERGMNIAALAQRTGVGADTLRKWEQRYGILRPARTAGGQRRYSERDVARVEWLRDRLKEGYRIGEAAALLGDSEIPQPRTPEELQDALYEAAANGYGTEIARLLDQTFALSTVERACEDVVGPLLRRIGDGWASGEIGIANEHLVSEAVRARLQSWLSYARGGTRGTAVLACAPGERHDLGLLMAGAQLRSDGWQVAFLGADTPPAEAVALAERLEADLVLFSVTIREHAAALAELGKPHRHERAKRFVGGCGANASLARAIGARNFGADLAAALNELRGAVPA